MFGVPARVEQLVSQSGLTHREFARRVKMEPTAFSKSLRGNRHFSAVEIVRIAELGNVTTDWLLRGS